jgi:glutamate 5-kinase
LKRSQKTSPKKIVVKVGSSVLTGGKTVLVAENLERIVCLVARLVKEGQEVILVSSGAVASGLSVLGLEKKPRALAELQAAAAAGQNILMQAYTATFARRGMKCAQILITVEDFNDRDRYLNTSNTINTLLKFGVVPVINENDTVSVAGIKFGDNDTLSARVAAAVQADGLLILTDIDGLYESYDPRTKKCGALLKEVKEINAAIERAACGTDKEGCVGGMSTKIEAAKIATKSGVPVILANGLKDDLEVNFSPSSCHDGTYFPVVSFVGGKKHWIAFEADVRGKILVDSGAKTALVQNHRSLLAPGVIGVQGNFQAGDFVEICDAQGKSFARGKVNFSSEKIKECKGQKNSGEIIHRDHLAITG